MKMKVILMSVFILTGSLMFGQNGNAGIEQMGRTIFYYQTAIDSNGTTVTPTFGGGSAKVILGIPVEETINIHAGIEVGYLELKTAIMANGGIGLELFEDSFIKGEVLVLAGLGTTITTAAGDPAFTASGEGLFNLILNFNRNFGMAFSTGVRYNAVIENIQLTKFYLPLGISLKILFQ